MIPAVSAVTVATALVFGGAGVANALDLGNATENFRAWGYPHGWRFVTSAVELGGAGALLSDRARPVGLAVLGLTITAAVVTLVRHKASAAHLAPAIGFAVLVGASGVLYAMDVP